MLIGSVWEGLVPLVQRNRVEISHYDLPTGSPFLAVISWTSVDLPFMYALRSLS
jgi:hypothetical protein